MKNARSVWVLAALLTAAPVSASTFNFSAHLDGLQENPANASPGIGVATGTLDDVTRVFSWSLSFSGLVGSQTGAHFHKGAVGVNGPVQVALTLGSPSAGSTTLTVAQVADLEAGLWYVNVHSSIFPGGEIRGQLTEDVPEPSALILSGLGLAALAFYRRTKMGLAQAMFRSVWMTRT